MPPEKTPEELAAEAHKDLNALTPERAEEVASIMAEQWSRDWGAILDLVVTKTGLSRSDAFQYIALRELSIVRSLLERGIQPKWHPDCEGCRREKEFHEAQWEAIQLTIRHLKDELGEEWKDGE